VAGAHRPGEGSPQGEAPRWGMRLLELWQGLARLRPQPHSSLGRLKALMLRLSEGWQSYPLHRRDPRVPATLVPPSRP
jgi:hypothetical protein